MSSPQQMHSDLVLEGLCEHCNRKPATVVFDRSVLCGRCAALLHEQLMREGKHDGGMRSVQRAS